MPACARFINTRIPYPPPPPLPPDHWYEDQGRAHDAYYLSCAYFVAGPRLPPETPEEARQRQESAARMLRRQEEARGAAERAEALLRKRLGFFAFKSWQLTGKLSRRSTLWPAVLYVIPRNAKVQVVRDGRVETELCVIADQGEPEADRVMTVLDLIESGQEAKLWEMANVFPQ